MTEFQAELPAFFVVFFLLSENLEFSNNDVSQHSKTSRKISGGIDECFFFFTMRDEMCHVFKDLKNSLNENFPEKQNAICKIVHE